MKTLLRYYVEQPRQKQPTLRSFVVSALKTSHWTKGEHAYEALQALSIYTVSDEENMFSRDALSETAFYLLEQIGTREAVREYVTENVEQAIKVLEAECVYADPHADVTRSTLFFPPEFGDSIPHRHGDLVEKAVIEWEANPWLSRHDMLSDIRALHEYATTGSLPETSSQQFEELLEYCDGLSVGGGAVKIEEESEDVSGEPEVVKKIRNGESIETEELDPELFTGDGEYSDVLPDALIAASKEENGTVTRSRMQSIAKEQLNYKSSSADKYSLSAINKLELIDFELPLSGISPQDELYTDDFERIVENEIELLRTNIREQVEVVSKRSSQYVDGIWMGKANQRKIKQAISELKSIVEEKSTIWELESIEADLKLIPDKSPSFILGSFVDVYHPRENYAKHPKWC